MHNLHKYEDDDDNDYYWDDDNLILEIWEYIPMTEMIMANVEMP